ncbi:hypothetical protein [Clostridium thermobutyricum]|uniref:Uncharacterized protein n=1 Tax=Clostridium thermobutyricum DSM 4928 TaxID=1121339 RepID=A0A1V4SXA5_9CLOT|nr:hypothetical protein [Clostridium thermobutyricum]OPX49141.1 hypothetical protein CLTHE_08950 [Clostridium thermobutyricum DSM 4928]
MGLLYENYLDRKDKSFVMSVIQGENLEYSYELKKPKIILEEFSIEDYTRTNILNYYLLDEILTSDNRNLELEKLIQTLFIKNKLDFINGYFEYNTLKLDLFEKFILKINEIVTDNFRKIINSSQITYECIKKYINIILLKYTNESNLKSNKEILKEYLDNYKDIFFEISECDESKLINTLKLLDIKLINLKNINGDISENLIFEIIENRLYELNIENIMYLINKFDIEYQENKVYEKNYSILNNVDKLKKVLDYVDSDIDSYLESIFNIKYDNLKNLKLRNDLSEVLNILNSDAKLENKLKFIEISSFEIKNIEDIGIELWDKTIENNNILKLYSNALKYINEKNLTSNIINYINSFKINEDIFSIDNKLENKGDLEEKILLNNEININVYNKICKKVDWRWEKFEDFDLLDEEKIKVLIENKIIIMEENTFKNIYEHYKDDNLDLINYFIYNNLEEYTKLIENKTIEFYEENMISLLENKDIKYEEKEKLIDLYDDNISLENLKNIDDKIKCYIIKNKFSDNDLEYIISNYKNLDNNKIKGEILKKVDKFRVYINFRNIDFTILLDYMGCEFIEQENKLEVLSNTISHKNNTEIIEMIKRLNIQEYKRALSGGKPKVEVNNINKNILDILKEKELISSYDEIEGYYKVYGKRKTNELISV